VTTLLDCAVVDLQSLTDRQQNDRVSVTRKLRLVTVRSLGGSWGGGMLTHWRVRKNAVIAISFCLLCM